MADMASGERTNLPLISAIVAVAGDTTNELALGLPAWRWMYLAQAVPAAGFLVALIFIPESPGFLVSKGRHDDAGGVLTRLFGETVARAKLEEIRGSFSADHRPALRDVLAPAGTRGFLGLRPIVWPGLCCWRCSSSWSASTSSSTTVRRSGSSLASRRAMRCSSTPCRARCRSPPAW